MHPITTLRLVVLSFLLTCCNTLKPDDTNNESERTFLQMASAGSIGCPLKMIKVDEAQSFGSVLTWAAHCKGKKFYCTLEDHTQMACTPELK